MTGRLWPENRKLLRDGATARFYGMALVALPEVGDEAVAHPPQVFRVSWEIVGQHLLFILEPPSESGGGDRHDEETPPGAEREWCAEED